MHKSINENLPKFLFPETFMASLPGDYAAFEPTEEQAFQYRFAITELEGSEQDYMFCMKAERIKRGILREARRYEDGTTFVRFDSPIGDSDNTIRNDVQFAMHLDKDAHLISYTNVYDEWKSTGAFCMNADCRNTVVLKSPEDILSFVRGQKAGREVRIAPNGIWTRALRLTKEECEGVATYEIAFYFDHPPIAFHVTGRSDMEMADLVRGFLEGGFRWLAQAADWEYYDAARTFNSMGLYMRLVCHRFMAEFMGDSGTLALLDALGVQDVPTTPLWMPRRGKGWSEIVDTLYRIARGPEESRVDNNGNPLSPLDCDRVVAYAALEGNAEARADVEARFGIRLFGVSEHRG